MRWNAQSHLHLREEASAVGGEVGPHEHVAQPLLDVGVEGVLLHGAAAVVDLVEDVDDARAEERRRDVEVVHEGVEQRVEGHHVGRAVLAQVRRVVAPRVPLAAPPVRALDLRVRQPLRAVARP